MNQDIPSLKNLFIIELSEFSVDILTQASQLYSLPHLNKVLQFKKSTYKTNDRYNSGHLTPAMQWTAVHAGVAVRKMAPPLKFGWEVLQEQGITTALWNVPNSEPEPERLTLFPTLGQRLKRHLKVFKKGLTLRCGFEIFKAILHFERRKDKQADSLACYLSWQDYASTLLFCKQKQKESAQCNILFLGALAFCQSYHWQSDDKSLSNELIYNMHTLDKILGHIMMHFPNESLIMHNALSQLKTPKMPDNTTGRFIPLGTVYSQELNFPNHIFNYEFNRYVFHYFLPQHYSLKSEYIEDEVFSE